MRIARAVAFRSSLNSMLKRANNLAVAALLGATVVATTHSPPARSQAVDLIRVDVQTVAKGYRASKLRGATVQNDKDEKIGVVVKVLADQTRAGRPVDDMDPEFREWIIDFGGSGYVALYRLDGETAAILAVRHQKEAGY